MNKLKFIFQHIKNALLSHTFIYIVIFFTALINGFATTFTYNNMKAEVGDLTRMFVPKYTISINYDNPDVVDSGTNNISKIIQYVLDEDSRFYREATTEVVTSNVVSLSKSKDEQISDDIAGRNLEFSWDKELFTEDQITKNNNVVIVPKFIADTNNIKIGDNIKIFDKECNVIGIKEEIDLVITPYTNIFENIYVNNFSIDFIPKENVTKDLKASVNGDIYMAKEYKPVYKLSILFILTLLISALNILLIAIYLAKKSRTQLSIYKTLGASNGLIANVLLIEIILLVLIGVVIGHGLSYAIIYAMNLNELFVLSYSFYDSLIIVLSNVVVTIAVCLYSIIRRSLKEPCER